MQGERGRKKEGGADDGRRRAKKRNSDRQKVMEGETWIRRE